MRQAFEDRAQVGGGELFYRDREPGVGLQQVIERAFDLGLHPGQGERRPVYLGPALLRVEIAQRHAAFYLGRDGPLEIRGRHVQREVAFHREKAVGREAGGGQVYAAQVHFHVAGGVDVAERGVAHLEAGDRQLRGRRGLVRRLGGFSRGLRRYQVGEIIGILLYLADLQL